MRSEFMLAINQLCAERKLSPEVVLEAVEASLISAYKRNFGSATNIEVRIEPNTGDVRVFAAKEVVDSVDDPKAQVTLEEARQVEPGVTMGETILVESTPRDFGRIAAQTAKQVILQRIREAERDALYSSFADSAGEIALGTIQSIDFHSNDVIVNLEGAEALLPAREQVPTERYRRGSRLRAYVVDVRRGNRGPQITLSRRSPALLRRLLELEVPEIFSGAVEIKAIAREAGSRSKVAVHATQEGVDPVGSCVGVRGGRIQNVVNELGGEKIDVVQWNPEVATFIANSLSPAKVMNVLLDDSPESGKTATVIVPDRQLSLAIGKEGQNARLAAKLTGWRIDIKSATEAAEETLGRFVEAEVAPEDMDLLSLAEALLRKQGTGKPVPTPEQRALIAEGMQQEPGQELVELEDAPIAEAELEQMAESDLADREAAQESQAEPGVPTAEQDLELAGVEVEGIGGEVTEVAAPVADADAEPGEELFEAEPPFEGEPIRDSLGWVSTEPQMDYYTGWAETDEEDEDEGERDEWAPDELEDSAEGEGRRKRKKGRKKKGRRDVDDNVDDWQWQGPSRPRW